MSKSLYFGACLTVVIFLFFYVHFESRLAALQIQQPAKAKAPSSTIPTILIYNRVPKTASTTLMNVPYELCRANKYRVVHVNLFQYKHVLTTADQMYFARNMSSWNVGDMPTFYHGHFAYFDFAKLGLEQRPIYINLVRKPLDRLVSYYYFLRYGDDLQKNKVRSKQGNTVTFDECVENSQADCDPKKLWMQIPFFCGQAIQCWDPGSEWALAQAKNNLVSKYLVVGVTEDLNAFVQVLETLLPEFFTGATDFFQISGNSHIKRTRHKDEVSEHSIQKLKSSKIWRMENEFYNFALRQFNWVKKTLEEQREQNKQFFYYEKIRT